MTNYRPISITSVQSKYINVRLLLAWVYFFSTNIILSPEQCAFFKGLDAYDTLLNLSHMLHRALDKGIEARLIQIDCRAAFDRVNHLGLLCKLCFLGLLDRPSCFDSFSRTAGLVLW